MPDPSTVMSDDQVASMPASPPSIQDISPGVSPDPQAAVSNIATSAQQSAVPPAQAPRVAVASSRSPRVERWPRRRSWRRRCKFPEVSTSADDHEPTRVFTRSPGRAPFADYRGHRDELRQRCEDRERKFSGSWWFSVA